MTLNAYYSSPLGIVRFQAEQDRIVAVQFIDEPVADRSERHPVLTEAVSQLDEYFAGRRKQFTLPLGQAGSEFQRQVWEAVYHIPYGEVRSYRQIAEQLGRRKAVRAVGAANGRNRLWIVVPCHRVIGSDGSLTGYAGGLWRKQWLLEHENKLFGP